MSVVRLEFLIRDAQEGRTGNTSERVASAKSALLDVFVTFADYRATVTH